MWFNSQPMKMTTGISMAYMTDTHQFDGFMSPPKSVCAQYSEMYVAKPKQQNVKMVPAMVRIHVEADLKPSPSLNSSSSSPSA